MRARGAQALDQGRDMREAAQLAVAARRGLVVEAGEGVRQPAAARHAEMLQERLSDQVRRLARRGAHPDIEARLAEIGRQQLRMRVGDVQQRNVAEGRQLVELVGGLGRAGARAQARARGGGEGEQAQEFASLHGLATQKKRGLA